MATSAFAWDSKKLATACCVLGACPEPQSLAGHSVKIGERVAQPLPVPQFPKRYQGA